MGRKRLVTTLKLQMPAGQASPAPPVGTALGPHGVNIMDFVQAYNEATPPNGDDHPGRGLDL